MISKNIILLDSPSKPFNPTIIKQQVQNDLQDSTIKFEMPLQSPNSLAFKYSTNPQSPWSACLNPNNNRISSQRRSLSNYRMESEEIQQINEPINEYSDFQQNIATPIKQDRSDEQQGEASVSQIQTTGRKQANNKRKSRPRDKGLRQLTQKVFNIIKSLEKATYKEVASKLVRQINEEKAIDEKQEKNIKRRVYDSLNVLFSLGALAKQGRFICYSQKINDKPSTTQKAYLIEQLKAQLVERQTQIKNKQCRLNQARQKYQLIQSFIQRNRQIKDKSSIIQFPYIGLFYNNTSISKEVPQESGMYIQSTVPFYIFGDIDSVKWLNQVPRQ